MARQGLHSHAIEWILWYTEQCKQSFPRKIGLLPKKEIRVEIVAVEIEMAVILKRETGLAPLINRHAPEVLPS